MHLIAALFAFSLPVDEVALWADYLDRCDAAILEQADYVVERLDEKHGNPYYRFEIHSRGGEHVLSQSALSPDGARLERFQGVNIRKDRVEIIDFPDHGSIDIVANDGELPMGRVAVPHPDWLGVQLGYHPCRAWAKGDIVRSYDPETLVLVHGPKNAPDMEYRVHFRRTDDGKFERLKEEKYAFGHKQMSWDYEVSDDGESKTYEVTFCLYGKDEIDGSEPVTTKHYRVHPPAHRASDELSFHEFPPDRTVTDFRSDPPLTYGSTGQRSIELPPGEADSLSLIHI